MQKQFHKAFNAETNVNWDENQACNKAFIKAQEQYANDVLMSKGYLTSYDLYTRLLQLLGFEVTPDLNGFGWLHNDEMHDKVSLDINYDHNDMFIDFKTRPLNQGDPRNKFLISLQDSTDEVAEYWGDMMPMMAMEEMAELTKAISKYERVNPLNDEYLSIKQDIIDEMGDVLISIMALTNRYGINVEDIDKRIDQKLNKVY